MKRIYILAFTSLITMQAATAQEVVQQPLSYKVEVFKNNVSVEKISIKADFRKATVFSNLNKFSYISTCIKDSDGKFTYSQKPEETGLSIVLTPYFIEAKGLVATQYEVGYKEVSEMRDFPEKWAENNVCHVQLIKSTASAQNGILSVGKDPMIAHVSNDLRITISQE
ncbi:MAG: hypothetical protein Q7T74_07175 [Candidatus Saccharibacteria bacterium]|nr:hypothetical protein [Candidatus Saccharibacteria bacterium]